jgi:hypothetical protein
MEPFLFPLSILTIERLPPMPQRSFFTVLACLQFETPQDGLIEVWSFDSSGTKSFDSATTFLSGNNTLLANSRSNKEGATREDPHMQTNIHFHSANRIVSAILVYSIAFIAVSD